MGVFIRILIPILLFPLVRWVVPRAAGWLGRRYERQQAEKRVGGPYIEGKLARPTRDLRNAGRDEE